MYALLMRLDRRIRVLALICLCLAPAAAQTATSRIVSAAKTFLRRSIRKQRQTVLFAFDDEKQRARWSNLPTFTHRPYYMGMVDEQNRVTFFDGMLRVVAPDGHEWARFHPNQYETYIEEHAEPWTYMKFCHLKSLGWRGFRDGPESGISTVSRRWLA